MEPLVTMAQLLRFVVAAFVVILQREGVPVPALVSEQVVKERNLMD
jgi:hypothetical protein